MDPVSAVGSSVAQVLLFAFVPFVFYLATRRRARGFLDYLGLRRKPSARAMLWATLAVALTAPLPLLLLTLPAFREISSATGTTGGRFSGLGLSPATVLAILVVAFVQSGLSEELLFRGFVGKRLIGALGFGRGNALQAVLFGSVHLLVFAVPGGPTATLPAVALVFLSPAFTGWVFGYLNERVGNGSIAPSWWAHGLGNAIAYSAAVLAA